MISFERVARGEGIDARACGCVLLSDVLDVVVARYDE